MAKLKSSTKATIGPKGAIAFMASAHITLENGGALWLRFDAPNKGKETWTLEHAETTNKIIQLLEKNL